MGVKLGVNLPQAGHYDLARDVAEAARRLEEIGYDSLWAYERLLVPGPRGRPRDPAAYGSTADPLIVLAMAAAVTSRAELGTGVLVAPLQVPLRLAKTLATLDSAAGGRLLAGLGSGWLRDEFDAVGLRPFAERGAALDEFLAVAHAVWGPDNVEFTGDRYRIGPATIGPKPARPIPVYLAGTTPATFRRIARRADGWIPFGISPALVAEGLDQIRELAVAAGRRPEDIQVVHQLGVTSLAEVPAHGREPYRGSPSQLVEDIAELVAGGVGHVYVTVATATRDVKELLDRAAELHEAVRGAGL
ncbi:TIGR03619 family F420-dependent LLM class oxidoreductase [Actinoplanes solisilvae]|uniref:TIGR03619 family F420-dependent LLM class oxidoreductase n=1 Tax=Actinoplanes solisilvae TaxID=2486853 RepID=UPI000FD99137|nr:TIGR03619 family F420-dependent LLM class oxidoreductase [Actinoplanes solisilvae]